MTETTSALCTRCNQPFHLQVRQDQPVQDCGAVWVMEPFMTLQYACNSCLGRDKGAPERVSGVPRQGRPRARRRYRKIS